ncbi:hypothetical protein KL86DYS1_31713 [uncultured Dysgonomonas sp.]|uniref:Uncharacterized protein n=1 Tax=uncultured Dysgonomonas sp. TaxID=206096 RepID=A0A212K7B4_9BACT|nr:hypothetical protein KL86DYS1_31713 [uncultured Dysgonomonas sp.]
MFRSLMDNLIDCPMLTATLKTASNALYTVPLSTVRNEAYRCISYAIPLF